MINNHSWLCILASSAYQLKQMIGASSAVYKLFVLYIYIRYVITKMVCQHNRSFQNI